jgi:cytochrome d ubiquinol oxidase subunit I
VPEDWWAAVFNPSFPYRLVHMVLAAYLTTAFAVGAVGAFHLLRDRNNEGARVMFSMALWMAALVAPIQIIAGDLHGLNTHEHQPAKVAAMEGHFETRQGAPLILFGMPNMAEERTDYAIEIPKLGSLILTHELDGEVRGLSSWPPEDRPNAAIVFWSFRIMVGLGLLMAAFGLTGLWLRWRSRLYASPWFQRAALLMGPSGFVAVLAGWITTEVGRQPYTVYGLLRTDESMSPIAAPALASSLTAFVVVYVLVFGAGVFYLLRLMRRPPLTAEPELEHVPIRTAGITPAPALDPGHSGMRAR